MKATIENNFDISDIISEVNIEVNEWIDGLVSDCRKAAKKFVDRIIAGQVQGKETWNNRTWNLRSSIGYLIVLNGEVAEEYFPEDTGSDGNRIGQEYAQEIALMVNEGIGVQIVIVAGMEYAIYVEGNKNVDVLTHASKGFPKVLLEEFNR